MRVLKLDLPAVAGVSVSMPVFVWGEGRPKLAVVAGIHGDEFAGLFVLERLARELPPQVGSVCLIPSANPLAQAMGQRVSPHEPIDLNRVFPGDASGSLAERLAVRLVEVLADADLVVDLHAFSLVSPMLAVFADMGPASVRARSLEAIRAFGPDAVWQLDIEFPEDRAYRGALAPCLHELGVANFAIEMPNHPDEDDIERGVRGLRQVMAWLEMVEGDFSREPLLMCDRVEFRAQCSGLFFPKGRLLAPVVRGQALGQIIDLAAFEPQPVYAPNDGLLLQLRERSQVWVGGPLFSLATRYYRARPDD